jgi:hypothetical protein
VHREDRPLGTSRRGIHRLLGRERDLLDREEEPDRERQRLEDPGDAEREPGTAPAARIATPSVLGMFVQQLEVELPGEDRARKKNTRTAIDSTVIVTVNRIVASIPTMLIPTKMM